MTENASGIFDPPDLPVLLTALLRQIPRGRVTSYGTLAMALGDRLAARWVGHFMRRHDHGDHCPCHRVVRADGQLGGYVAGTIEEQAARLRGEGIDVVDDAVDRDLYGFDAFESARPLLALRDLQRDAATRLVVRAPRQLPRTVAGLDVSYHGTHAVGGYALVDFPGGELIWSTTVSLEVSFPYIQSFLTFRELPVLLALAAEARRQGRLADVCLVDGSGLIHQRQIGLASHFGVTVGWSTIGVTKKLLCGRVDCEGLRHRQSRPVFDGDAIVGVAMRSASPAEQILYISPGHKVDVDYAARVVAPLLAGHRLPEPLYWADRLSRQAARAHIN